MNACDENTASSKLISVTSETMELSLDVLDNFSEEFLKFDWVISPEKYNMYLNKYLEFISNGDLLRQVLKRKNFENQILEKVDYFCINNFFKIIVSYIDSDDASYFNRFNNCDFFYHILNIIPNNMFVGNDILRFFIIIFNRKLVDNNYYNKLIRLIYNKFSEIYKTVQYYVYQIPGRNRIEGIADIDEFSKQCLTLTFVEFFYTVINDITDEGLKDKIIKQLLIFKNSEFFEICDLVIINMNKLMYSKNPTSFYNLLQRSKYNYKNFLCIIEEGCNESWLIMYFKVFAYILPVMEVNKIKKLIDKYHLLDIITKYIENTKLLKYTIKMIKYISKHRQTIVFIPDKLLVTLIYLINNNITSILIEQIMKLFISLVEAEYFNRFFVYNVNIVKLLCESSFILKPDDFSDFLYSIETLLEAEKVYDMSDIRHYLINNSFIEEMIASVNDSNIKILNQLELLLTSIS